MPHYLSASLFDSDVENPDFQEDLSNKVSDIRIIWELHGGVRTIELDWRGDETDAYSFYKDRLGYRVVVWDNFCDFPVADGFMG